MTAKRRSTSRNDPAASRSVGRAIKVLRTARGLERRDLAERAGVSYAYLSEIENGTKPGSQGVLRAIAEALGVPMHELLAAAEEFGETEAEAWSYASEPQSVEARPARWFGAARVSRAVAPLAMPPAAPMTAPGGRREALIAELERLLPGLSEEDLARILDLVRRLAR